MTGDAPASPRWRSLLAGRRHRGPSDAAPALRWVHRAGLGFAVFVYLLYSSFGIAAPFWWGHHGYHGATYMLRARMTLRLHILTPATWGGFEMPPKAALYFHHPVGYHYILSLLIPVFGDHEWLARGVAVAGGLVALWALYALVARFWSRWAGLVAVVVYVCLPVLASFSVLSDPMLLEMACVLWGLWAYLSLLERPTRRALVHAFFAYALGGFIMWEVYFIGPFIALHAAGYLLTRRGRTLRLGRLNALVAHTLVIGAACCLMMAFHLWFTHHAGLWDDFLDSYRLRHAPPSAQYVIGRHVEWVDILYGRAPLVAGALWFVLWLGRVATGRTRRRDLAPLAFLYVNTIYIYMFAEGSSVHLYRVFFYSSFFTLAVTDLVSDACHAARRLARRAPAWVPAAGGAAALAVYLVAVVPHALHNLVESRVMMGTHGERNYSPRQDKLRFAAEVHARTTRDQRVIIDYPHLGARKELWYYLDRNFDEIQSLAQVDKLRTRDKSVLLLDERMLNAPDRAVFDRLIQQHPVTFFERYTMVDLRSNRPHAQSYAFVPQPMSARYRWFVSHKYPPLALVPRAWLPGECEALALGVPLSIDEDLVAPADAAMLPCYHDLLVTHGQIGRARAVARQITAGMRQIGAPLGPAEVLAAGTRNRRLDVVLLAHGTAPGALRYVLSRDGKPGPTLPSSVVAPARWRPGFVYVEHIGLPPGRWDAEAQLVEMTVPPPGPGRPAAPPTPKVMAHTALGPVAR